MIPKTTQTAEVTIVDIIHNPEADYLICQKTDGTRVIIRNCGYLCPAPPAEARGRPVILTWREYLPNETRRKTDPPELLKWSISLGEGRLIQSGRKHRPRGKEAAE